jgi:hypothetical protein
VIKYWSIGFGAAPLQHSVTPLPHSFHRKPFFL